MDDDQIRECTDAAVGQEAYDETAPLLDSQQTKPRYVTFPKSYPEEQWKPSAGFWWIETGMHAVHRLTVKHRHGRLTESS